MTLGRHGPSVDFNLIYAQLCGPLFLTYLSAATVGRYEYDRMNDKYYVGYAQLKFWLRIAIQTSPWF